MSFRPFEISASGELTAQPASAGEKLVIVSDNTADTGDTVTVRGIVAAAAASNTVTLSTDGRIEKETTDSFTSLTGISTSGLTGVASIYGQGTAGQGDNLITAIPLKTETLVLGVAGFAQTYTFRSPCRETILCPAGSTLVTGASPGSYVKITLNGVAKYFWFSNGTSTDPAPGGTGYAVAFTGGDTAATIATALLASMATNLTNFASSRDTATITITGIALGVITISQDAGADFTLTEIEPGVADAANQIRTSYDVDGSTATPTDVALWIQYAVNASGGTAGTHYGTGTAANAYVTASAASTTTTFTDRIACHRSLGWTVTAPATGSTARTVIGGAYGTLLATITSTQTIRVAQDFNNPDISDDTLLALFTGATDGILTNGQPSVLRLYINNVSSAVVLKVQASDSGVTDPDSYYDISGTTALTGTVAGTAAAYTLTGTSTLFTTELKVGDWIVISTYAYRVASIASDTSLAVEQPLVTSPSGTSAVKRLPVQLASLDNNSQFIQLPQCEYVRINFTTNSNTTDSKLHAGLIV